MRLRNSCIFFEGNPDRKKLTSRGWKEQKEKLEKEWRGVKLTFLPLDGWTGAVVTNYDNWIDFDLTIEAFQHMRSEWDA